VLSIIWYFPFHVGFFFDKYKYNSYLIRSLDQKRFTFILIDLWGYRQ